MTERSLPRPNGQPEPGRFSPSRISRDTRAGINELWTSFRAFFLPWLKLAWFDVLVLVVAYAVSLGIYQVPPNDQRLFPITHPGSTDIVWPEIAYPYRDWTVPSAEAAVISILVPVAIILIAQIRVRSWWDLATALVGLGASLCFATLAQVFIKVFIGGYRPHFLEVCKPDISLAESRNATGRNGVGYMGMFYSIDICTTPVADLQNAITSFPSGHSSTIWAGMGYLFLYLNAKLKVWSNYRPAMWKMIILFAPIVGSTLFVAVLTIDNAHHWYDVVVGSLIGILFSFAAYRAHYAAVWDWRYNHLPLKYEEPFAFDFSDPSTDYSAGTCTKAAGWGTGAAAHWTQPLAERRTGNSSSHSTLRSRHNATATTTTPAVGDGATAAAAPHAEGHRSSSDTNYGGSGGVPNSANKFPTAPAQRSSVGTAPPSRGQL